ncbi:MAG TPA: hypothetical protein DCX06_05130 [Opitutae bacterium]|nr:hypothetical protein [Opitutae bacterium]
MKNKQKDEANDFPCFQCEKGTMQLVYEDFETEAPDLGSVSVPHVPLHRCNQCDCVVVGDEGGEAIDAYLDKISEAITPKEIQAFLDKYGITQKEAAEITGYGEKNISRWLRGHMRPSKSVSNNLRTLLASREAFEILRKRNWNREESPKLHIEDRQPDEEEKKILSFVDYRVMVEMGLVKKSQSPKEKRSELCQLFKAPNLQGVEKAAQGAWEKMAAYQDTSQQTNPISAGMWCWIGEQAAASITVEPFDRDKLDSAVKRLREYTQHDDVLKIIPEVKEELRKAGVALVFVPIMKQSALRGCTKLMTPAKAVIVHGLKYRNHAQFWRVLFHEIGHLMLHLNKAGESITDYENQKDDQREQEADQWADGKLVASDELTRFYVRHQKPHCWEVQNFARSIKTHPAIVAEIFNKRAQREVIQYSLLRKNKLYPSISEGDVKKLGKDSATRVILGDLY